jgi:hypothetical protein
MTEEERTPDQTLADHTHKSSGLCCLAHHVDKDGNVMAQCIICEKCGEHIRPEDMNNICKVTP